MKLYYQKVTYYYKITRPYKIRTNVRGYECVTPFIRLDKDGVLYVSKDYAWDGPSGPTVDTKSSLAASLVHDVFYQLMRLGLLPRSCRAEADKELRRIGIDKGMFPPRAEMWYIAVRSCAGDAVKKGTEPKEEVAP